VTHYELLGMPADASQDEIRAAYRALARRHHPDTQHDVDPATADRSRQTMALLNAAWAVVGDPVRRRAYDDGLGRPAPARPMGSTGYRGPGWDWQPLSDDVDDPEELDDEPYGDPRPRRPADSMVMTPVLLVFMAVALFFFSTMVQSAKLRTLAILLLPIAGVGFVAAPLFVILRGRSREG
jgi:curved DNA-binding protein CbpA